MPLPGQLSLGDVTGADPRDGRLALWHFQQMLGHCTPFCIMIRQLGLCLVDVNLCSLGLIDLVDMFSNFEIFFSRVTNRLSIIKKMYLQTFLQVLMFNKWHFTSIF